MKRIITCIMVLVLCIASVPALHIAAASSIKVSLLDSAGFELSVDETAPSKLDGKPLTVYAPALANREVYFQMYWYYGASSTTAKFDDKGFFELNIAQPWLEDEHSYMLQMSIFAEDSYEGIKNGPIAESPIYSILRTKEEASVAKVGVMPAVSSIALSADTLSIKLRDGFRFDGFDLKFIDITTNTTEVIPILYSNERVSRDFTTSGNLIITGFNIDLTHDYAVQFPRYAIYHSERTDGMDWADSFAYFELAAGATGEFSDFGSSHWSFGYVANLAKKNVINGYENGEFRSEASVNRKEFAKMMVKKMQMPKREPLSPNFTDVSKDDWSYTYVESTKGFMNNYGDTFRGNDAAIREDMAVALVKAMGLESEVVDVAELDSLFSDSDTIDHELKKYILIAYKNGIIDGYPDGTFGAKKTITRGETAALLVKAYNSESMLSVSYQ